MIEAKQRFSMSDHDRSRPKTICLIRCRLRVIMLIRIGFAAEAPRTRTRPENGGPLTEDQTTDRPCGDVRLFPGRSPGPTPHAHDLVTFDRHELRNILNLYGRKVAEGEWRDYAMDFTRDKAVFSIFRRASEYPLFRVEKVPKLARKQGAFSVVTTTGVILKRGHELKPVIDILDKKLKLVKT